MKRLVYLVFAFILTVPMSAYAATAETSTFAAQKENEYSQEYYDKIIEELSNEYGLEIRQGMPNDIDGKTTQLIKCLCTMVYFLMVTVGYFLKRTI